MRAFLYLLAFVINGLLTPQTSAGHNTPGQAEIKQLIQTMYTYDPSTFEHGNFNGKYSPQEHCKLLQEYFRENIIIKIQHPKAETCEIEYLRYPTLSSEDVSITTRIYPIPQPLISPPIMNKNKAKIAVVTGGGNTHFNKGRSLFFLTKTEQGWRIDNAMIHFKWPDLDDGVHNCYYKFARPPSIEEKREIPSHCN